ncbi:UNVERIFIED_CONTAM: Autophagy-related protein 18a [Sesamum radiatum]|uniref:Autophagy-related protein 18a n=1 Tax=Sesamum radiatum TaxID=300843 RepID=A0AAW2S5Y8_SESRA
MASPSTAAGPTIGNPRNPDATPPPSILHLSFNHEGGSFAVGTTDGFMIFNTDPFEFVPTIPEDFPKNGQGGGVSAVQRSLGVVAVVPVLRRDKIMIWDDSVGKWTGQLYLGSEVKSVRLRPDCIVAVEMQKISVYDLTDNMRLLHDIKTGPNPKGLCEISRSKQMVLVCLGLNKGEVMVKHCLFGLRRERLIKAHDSDVACCFVE